MSDRPSQATLAQAPLAQAPLAQATPAQAPLAQPTPAPATLAPVEAEAEPAPEARGAAARASVRPAAPPGAEPGPARFGLRDFVAGEDTRLRDLLAFGMAVEAGRPPGQDGIDQLRRKAEAELEAHAFRVLHNQAEAIRRQAADEQLAKLPRGLSFTGVVVANFVALALAAFALLLALSVEPRLLDHLAQLLARFQAGS